jgi:IS605 OrfB family transposase
MLPKRDKVGGKPVDEMKRRKTVTAKASDFVLIRGLRFRHGQQYIADALTRNLSDGERTALTYRFIRDGNGRWYVHLSLDVPETSVFDTAGGAIGVDFNEDHIAATIVDKFGNFICCRRFELNLYGVSSLHAKDMIRCVARDISLWAKSLGLPLVGEALDFKKKKLSMAGFSAKRARKLSSLHYSAWGQALRSRCHKDGVALKLVNPAYSSLIGRVKFASSVGLSVHNAAAMVIARRGMNLSERLPKAPVTYPDGVGTHGTLSPVVNTGHRHVWVYWAKAAKAVNNAAHVALISVKASRAAGNTPKQVLDEAIPFSWTDPEGGASRENSGETPERRPGTPIAGRLSPLGGSTAPMTGQTTQPLTT